MTYNPDFSRNSKGKFNLDNNFVSVKSGSEAYLIEDELNELQWIQNEQRAQTMRSLASSGLLTKLNILDTNTNIDETLYVKSYGNTDMNGAILYNIQNYIIANINGYFIKLAGTYNKDIMGGSTSNNNILIPLAPAPISNNRYDLTYLEVWFEEIDTTVNNDIKYYGGNPNNDIGIFEVDSRLGAETTHRIQLKWDIVTATNAKNMTDNTVFPRNDILNSNYCKATDVLHESYSKDKNLYVSRNNNGNILDGTYYAIPLFSVYRLVGQTTINAGNCISLDPIASINSNEVTGGVLTIIDENGNKIRIINNNGTLEIKNENNTYADLALNDLILHTDTSTSSIDSDNVVLHNEASVLEIKNDSGGSTYRDVKVNNLHAQQTVSGQNGLFVGSTDNKIILQSTDSDNKNYMAVENSAGTILSTLGHDGSYWYANGYKIAVINSSGFISDSSGSGSKVMDLGVLNSNTFTTLSGTNQKDINKSIDTKINSLNTSVATLNTKLKVTLWVQTTDPGTSAVANDIWFDLTNNVIKFRTSSATWQIFGAAYN